MKNPENKQGKYAYLEQLTTEELDELLRLDFNADEEDADPELVLAIMEVIMKREPESIPQIKPEETWKTFQARNLTEEPENEAEQEEKQEKVISFPQEYQLPHKRKRWLTSVVAAACAVFVFCAPVAHGSTVLETMVNWKQSTFSLPNQQETGTVAVLTNPDYLKVVEAVKAYTDTPLLPNWYPDGTTVDYVEDNSDDNVLSYCVAFTRAEQRFSLYVLAYDEESSMNSTYEKNANSGAVQYTSDGMPYYVMKNVEQTAAIWQGDKAEYSLSGFLTEEEIADMLNSIDLGDDENVQNEA